MKLLFDQNISFRVVQRLADVFPLARHVKDFGLQNATDRKILEFAGSEGYDLVTFDADFFDMVTLSGVPPKIIWVRTGNTSSGELAEILRNHAISIRRFLEDEDHKNLICLEISLK